MKMIKYLNIQMVALKIYFIYYYKDKLIIMKKKPQHVLWLQAQYDQNQDFQRIINQAQTTYKQSVQLALYTNFQNIEKLKIIQKISQDYEHNDVIAVYGMFIPNDANLVKKTHLLIINFLEQFLSKIINRYTIIYINTLCENYHNYQKFRNIIKSLPLKFYIKLDKIIILHPNFTIKSLQWFSFGTINKFLGKCIHYIENLQELQLYDINPKEIKLKMPKQLQNLDRVVSEPQIQKPKLVTHKISPNLIKNDFSGFKLEEYQICQEGIPMVIKNLFLYFQMNPESCKLEGIFRKNGNFEQQKQLQNHILNKNYDYLSKVQDPYIVCGLIKKIFNNMQVPLFDFQIYEDILRYNGDIHQQPYKQFIFQILNKLKPLNYNTLQFTLSNIIEKIIKHKSQNKMNQYNIAVVFSPCFFRPKQYKFDDLIHSVKFTKFLQNVIQNFTHYFGNKVIQDKAYHKSQQKSIKEYRESILIQNDNEEKKSMYNRNKELQLNKSISMTEILNFDD